MMKSLQLGNVILCEHATYAGSNRFTLVNLFVGDIRFDALPTESFFTLFIEHCPNTNESIELHFDVFVLGAKIGELVSICPKNKSGRTGAIKSDPFFIELDKPGTIEVFAYADGYRRKKIMSKQILLSPTSAK